MAKQRHRVIEVHAKQVHDQVDGAPASVASAGVEEPGARAKQFEVEAGRNDMPARRLEVLAWNEGLVLLQVIGDFAQHHETIQTTPMVQRRVINRSAAQRFPPPDPSGYSSQRDQVKVVHLLTVRKFWNNARWETVASLWTYKGPWSRGQRCVIPAESYDEPNWESGKNEWWSFRRADAQPWHLAGLWNTWTDPETGEVHESYSMITMNCDAHSLLWRFHKPEPHLPADQQDKRSVVAIDLADVRTWLTGGVDEAESLIRLPDASVFDAAPSAATRPGV